MIIQSLLSKEYILPIAIVFATMLIAYRLVIRRPKDPSARQTDARARIAAMRDQHEIRGNLERLIVQLQDLSRQIAGQIDTRFCKLQVLMDQADQKIRQLQQLTDGVQANGDVAQQQEPQQQEQPLDPERRMIYELADSGKNAIEIAQATNKDAGEIELILALRRSSNNSKRIDHTIE